MSDEPSSWLGLDLDTETNDTLAIAVARIEREVRKRAKLVTVTPSAFRREVKAYLDMPDVLDGSQSTRVGQPFGGAPA